MQSFDFMSEEALDAICSANDKEADEAGHYTSIGRNYQLTLNPSDFRNLVAALAYTYNYSSTTPEYASTEDLSEWCGQFLSGVASTLDVEMI